MKKGISIVGVMVVSLILISSVAMVSAGFKDLFTFGDDSDLEGELANTDTAQASVTITQADPPEIVWVSAVEDGGSSAPGDNAVKPEFKPVSLTTTITFSFIAQSASGEGVLYIDSSGDSLTNAKLISPAGVGENLGGAGGECSFVSRGAQSEIGGADGIEYACTVEMDFWSIPDNSNGWGIEVIVEDQNQQTGTNITKTFNVEETIQGSVDVNAFDWGSIAITSVNTYSQNPVVITNEGNGALDMSVTGAEVQAADYAGSGKAIDADRFRATNVGVGCTGGNLLDDGVGPKSSGLNVVRGSDSTGDLYSCITNLNGLGLTAQIYTSRIDWIVDMA
jgi:hypothetical protein